MGSLNLWHTYKTILSFKTHKFHTIFRRLLCSNFHFRSSIFACFSYRREKIFSTIYQSLNCFSILLLRAGLSIETANACDINRKPQARRDNNNFSECVSYYLCVIEGEFMCMYICTCLFVQNENVTMHLNVQQNRCLPISVLLVCQWVALVYRLLVLLFFFFFAFHVLWTSSIFFSFLIHKMKIKTNVRIENKWNWLN